MSKLTVIFSSVLGIDESKITPELSPDNESSWDSLNAILLITEMERAFGIKFKYNEAMGVKKFADVKNLLKTKGIDPDA